MIRTRAALQPGLAYADTRGRIFYDAALRPLADGGDARDAAR
jgi:hypothetical protein